MKNSFLWEITSSDCLSGEKKKKCFNYAFNMLNIIIFISNEWEQNNPIATKHSFLQ